MASAFTEERAIWLYEHYRWLERHLPRRTATSQARMVLPTKNSIFDFEFSILDSIWAPALATRIAPIRKHCNSALENSHGS
jgi:hypothetical protein